MDPEVASTLSIAGGTLVGTNIANYSWIKRDLVYQHRYLGRPKEEIIEKYQPKTTLEKIGNVLAFPLNAGLGLAVKRFEKGKFDDIRLNTLEQGVASMSVGPF